MDVLHDTGFMLCPTEKSYASAQLCVRLKLRAPAFTSSTSQLHVPCPVPTTMPQKSWHLRPTTAARLPFPFPHLRLISAGTQAPSTSACPLLPSSHLPFPCPPSMRASAS
eukprot:365285-Chlamydomonas_euryale.AAC.11